MYCGLKIIALENGFGATNKRRESPFAPPLAQRRWSHAQELGRLFHIQIRSIHFCHLRVSVVASPRRKEPHSSHSQLSACQISDPEITPVRANLYHLPEAATAVV